MSISFIVTQYIQTHTHILQRYVSRYLDHMQHWFNCFTLQTYSTLRLRKWWKMACIRMATICLFTVLSFNPLNTESNPICLLLALLWAHRIIHLRSIRVNEAHSCGLGKGVPIYATHGPWTQDLMLIGHTWVLYF